jgi:hypothetical protein
MTELEKLRVQLNQIVDAIVIEAKKQTVTVVPTLSSTEVPVKKQDLVSHIKETFTIISKMLYV